MSRTYLTSPLTLQASPGTDLGSIYSVIRDSYDLCGQTITVQIADGSYPSCVFDGPLTGAKSPASLQFIGNAATPYKVAIGNGPDALTLSNGARAQVVGMGFVGSYRQLVAMGSDVFFGNCWFNKCSLAQVDGCGSANLVLFGDVVMLDGADYAFLAEQQTQMLLRGYTIQWGGATPSYKAGFYADQFSIIDLTSCKWAYRFAGKQYDGGGFGVISVNGAGPNFIPGSLPGSFSFPPGWYN